jgi:hypothetical protein
MALSRPLSRVAVGQYTDLGLLPAPRERRKGTDRIARRRGRRVAHHLMRTEIGATEVVVSGPEAARGEE